jgi:hypothetical protein
VPSDPRAEPEGRLGGRRRAGAGRAELKTGAGSRGRLKTGGGENRRRKVEDGHGVTHSTIM